MGEEADEETDIQGEKERRYFHPGIQLPGISPYITLSFDTLPTLGRHSWLSDDTHAHTHKESDGILLHRIFRVYDITVQSSVH